MRLHRLSQEDVAKIVTAGKIVGVDPHGRTIFGGETNDGRSMEVVMALDAPDFVITVFGEVE
jgi:hypothetical protein